MFVAAKAIGLSSRDSSLVVESLGGAVGEEAAGGEPVEQLATMRAERACERLERGEPRAHGHGGPAVEEATGVQAGDIGPEVLELLFEQAGPDRAQVDAEQQAQPTALLGLHVFRSLEQQPPRLGEQRRPAARAKAANLV